MKKNKKGFSHLEPILLIILAGIIGFIGWYVWSVKNYANKSYGTAGKSTNSVKPSNKISPQQPTNNGPSKFTGEITSDGCATSSLPIGDVGCSITINSNVKIEVKHGNSAQQQAWGEVDSEILTSDATGKKVVVYAKQLNANQYTLAGSASYYVKVTQ